MMETMRGIACFVALALWPIGSVTADPLAPEELLDALITAPDDTLLELVVANPNSAKAALHQIIAARERSPEDTGLIVFSHLLSSLRFEAFERSQTLDTLLEQIEQAARAEGLEQALTLCRRGLDLARTREAAQYECTFQGNLGSILLAKAEYREAILATETAKQVCRSSGSVEGEAAALLHMGKAYHRLGRTQPAIAELNESLRLFELIERRPELAQVLVQLGNAELDSGNFENAEHTLQRVLTVSQDLEDPQLEGDSLLSLGNLLLERGQIEQAIERFEQAIDRYREANYPFGLEQAYSNIGVAEERRERYVKALAAHQAALDIVRDLDRPSSLAETLLNLGAVHTNLGNFAQARSRFAEASEIFLDVKDSTRAGQGLFYLADAERHLGELALALRHSREAIELLKTREAGHLLGRALNVHGLLLIQFGQLEEAERALIQARDMAKRRDDIRSLASSLMSLAILYRQQDRMEDAIATLEDARTHYQRLDDERGEASVLGNLGNIHSDLADPERAIEYYQQAFDLLQGKEGGRRRAGLLLNIASAELELSRYTQALDYCSKAADEYGLEDDSDALWLLHRNRAKALEGLNKTDVASVEYRLAIEAIESGRKGIDTPEHRLSYVGNKLYVYDDFLSLLANRPGPQKNRTLAAEAFTLFERKQGRVFLEQMGESGARRFEGLRTLFTAEKELAGRLTETREELLAERRRPVEEQEPELVAELVMRERDLLSEQAGLRERMRLEYPKYDAIRYPSPITPEWLQRQVLAPDEVLLVYAVLPSQTLLWHIQRDRFEMYQLPVGRDQLAKLVTELRAAVETRAHTGERRRGTSIRLAHSPEIEWSAHAHELYELLLPEGVRPRLEGQQLIVVPSGPLYDLPFEILAIEPGDEPRYLIERSPIVYISSVSLLNLLRQAIPPSGRRSEGVLILANPDYTGIEDASAAPLFNPLPETESEAKKIAAFFTADTAKVLLESDASKKAFLQLDREGQLERYRYLHFAIHGVLTQLGKGQQPALVLSQPERGGYLTLDEIFGLRLDAELVVLSACSTGAGDPSGAAEGIRGLTGAFMYAGSDGVVVTLWPVETHSAKAISIGLFRGLVRGKVPAAALQDIKREMLDGQYGMLWRHPYYWSPFVLFGDGSHLSMHKPVPAPRKTAKVTK